MTELEIKQRVPS